MEREADIKPCPMCMLPMSLRKTTAVVDGGYRKWFFFLYCSQCGYGPNNAFDTIYQAVTHWNDTALPCPKPNSKQLLNHASNTYPRMFS